MRTNLQYPIRVETSLRQPVEMTSHEISIDLLLDRVFLGLGEGYSSFIPFERRMASGQKPSEYLRTEHIPAGLGSPLTLVSMSFLM